MTGDSRDELFEINRLTQDSWQMFRMMGELAIGFDRLSNVKPKLVTIFGSARTGITDQFYIQAMTLAKELVEAGFGVITGGGPGIMEAANKGAQEAGGVSIGVNIALPKEQVPNRHQTISLQHENFHTRKLILRKYSVGFAVFPGGFGTLDELLEVLTLIQTQKLKPIPIFLVNSAYWKGLLGWFQDTLAVNGAIATDDIQLFKVVDDLSIIPKEISDYHDKSINTSGFKIPTEEDRRKAMGYFD